MIETGVDSMTGAGGQWEDGANTLAVGAGVLVCDERNTETNSRLAAAGYEIVSVPCGELGGVRGGPRCLCSPMVRAGRVPTPTRNNSGSPVLVRG